jgi:murein tripeptide amidase MpaA
MRNVCKTAAIACLLGVWLLAALAYAQPSARRYDGYQVVRVKIENESERKTLRALDAASRDFQIWSDRLRPGIIDVRVSPKQKRMLDASGLRYVVEIEDVQQRLDEMFKGAGEPEFFDSYRTYLEHVTFLSDLAEAYPDLAEMLAVGHSVLGRPMWTIRITGPGENKPGVMYHGAQHGNEVMGACVVAYMAEYLLTRYDSDPEVRTLVDNVEWYLLTIMNPDGYEANDRHNANEVDLNRNWGGPGAGHEPFSQPETSAMRDFFL